MRGTDIHSVIIQRGISVLLSPLRPYEDRALKFTEVLSLDQKQNSSLEIQMNVKVH